MPITLKITHELDQLEKDLKHIERGLGAIEPSRRSSSQTGPSESSSSGGDAKYTLNVSQPNANRPTTVIMPIHPAQNPIGKSAIVSVASNIADFPFVVEGYSR